MRSELICGTSSVVAEFRSLSRRCERAALVRDLSVAAQYHLQKVGHAATFAGRMKTSRRGSSSGPRGKDLARAKRKELREYMHTRLLAVHDGITSRAALAEIEQSTSSTDDVACLARLNKCAAARVKLEEMRNDVASLGKFSCDIGAPMVAAFAQAFPNAPVEELTAAPNEFGVALTSNFASDARVGSIAALSAHYNTHYGRELNVPKQLDKAWVEANGCMMDKDNDIPEAAEEKSQCRDAGICICTEPGKSRHRMKCAFHTQCSKPIAKAHTAGRVAIKEGRLAWVFIGTPPPPKV